MRHRLISLLAAAVLVACFSLAAPTVASACMLQERGGTGRTGTGEFDHHDFSGIWLRAMGKGEDAGGDCGFSPANMIPPLTKEGEEAIKKNKRDLERLAGLAHQLKGTARAYGFPQLTDQAAALEAAVVTGQPLDHVRTRVSCVVELCRAAGCQ